MSENKKAFIVAFILVLVISIISVSLVACSKYVYADELSDNAILNFNQLYNATYSNSGTTTSGITYKVEGYKVDVSGTATANVWVNLGTSVNCITDHYYYLSGINGNATGFNACTLFINNTRQQAQFINLGNGYGQILKWTGTSAANTLYLQFASSYSFNGTFYLQVIDLTQMFGVNAPLTVAEVKNYLPLDYYNYTTGTPVAIDSFGAFSQGYQAATNDYLASQIIVSNNRSSYNSMSFINIGDFDGTSLSREFINGKYSIVLGNTTLGFLPFYIEANSLFKITGGSWTAWGTGFDYPIDFKMGYIVDNAITWFYQKSLTSSQVWEGLDLQNEYLIPYDISGIVFSCSEQSLIVDITCEYKTWNLQAQIDKAFESGQESINVDKIKADARQEGYNDGLAANNPYTFRALFTSIFDVPIRALFGYKDINPYIVDDYGHIIYDIHDDPVPNPNYGKKIGGLFNFYIEDFGLDLSSVAMALITISFIVIIVKFAMGRS